MTRGATRSAWGGEEMIEKRGSERFDPLFFVSNGRKDGAGSGGMGGFCQPTMNSGGAAKQHASGVGRLNPSTIGSRIPRSRENSPQQDCTVIVCRT